MKYVILLKLVIFLINVDNISGSDINVTRYEGVGEGVLNSLPELQCKQVEVLSDRVMQSCIFDNNPRQIFMAGYNETSCFLCYRNTSDVATLAKMRPSNMSGLNWFARQGPGDDANKTDYGTYIQHSNYHSQSLFYPQAEALCRVSGAQIVAFETKAELQAVVSGLIGTQYWLNGNDRRQDGHYVWETNLEPATNVIPWAPNRDPKGQGEHFLLLGGVGQLYDNEANLVNEHESGVLCEF